MKEGEKYYGRPGTDKKKKKENQAEAEKGKMNIKMHK